MDVMESYKSYKVQKESSSHFTFPITVPVWIQNKAAGGRLINENKDEEREAKFSQI